MTLAVASSAFRQGYRIARTIGPGGDVDLIVLGILALGARRAPFAFEGAAMGCRLQDERRGGRLADDLSEEADPHWQPFIELGLGCASARLGHPPPRSPMVLDGYGFQWGLLDGISGIRSHRLPPRGERGRGRALWFLTGGDGRGCARVLDRSPHADELWRGVATACAFAGDPLEHAPQLPELAAHHVESLAIGASDAVAMWVALGVEVPARVRRVQEAISAPR